MKVVYPEEALKDLDAIADRLIFHYPAVAVVVERRIRSVVAHRGGYGADTPHPSRRTATLGPANLARVRLKTR
jgi:plasmid stabilization system protein ParE